VFCETSRKLSAAVTGQLTTLCTCIEMNKCQTTIVKVCQAADH